jgi:hypothetical protein
VGPKVAGARVERRGQAKERHAERVGRAFGQARRRLKRQRRPTVVAVLAVDGGVGLLFSNCCSWFDGSWGIDSLLLVVVRGRRLHWLALGSSGTFLGGRSGGQRGRFLPLGRRPHPGGLDEAAVRVEVEAFAQAPHVHVRAHRQQAHLFRGGGGGKG